ncbi:MAG: S41 family peptidase [Planctomycetota bacterium]|nr:S41 family peptidase [Planctomycetota bacterium]
MAWLLALSLLIGSWPVQVQAAEKPTPLTPEQVAALLPQLFKLHLKEHEMNGAFMKRVLKEYLNNLDPSHSFFLKSEADAITDVSDEQLRKLAETSLYGDLSYFTTTLQGFLNTQIARDKAMYDGLEKRADEVKALLKKDKPKAEANADKGKDPTPEKPDAKTAEADKDAGELAQPAVPPDDLEDPEEIAKANERPLTQADREKRLLKATAGLYRMHKTYLSENEAYKQAVLTVREDRARWLGLKVDDEVPKLFLKSFMAAMDPHTVYFDAEEDEEFTSRLEPSFAGIGVQIRPCPLGAQVEDIIKGGPADKSGKFEPNDQIVQVDDYVLCGLPINKIVRRIKGKKGTEVKLTVLKSDTRQTEIITLVRDEINLAELRVKGKKFDTPAGLVGLISVTTFYRGVHGDVQERIKELSKDKPLAALVLDLRDNHGGYLEEAVALAGLFIGSGWIVGERDGRDVVNWKDDPDAGTAYGGPLVVLTNQYSASASEIVAGTLKDYGRAVIAAPTQTFGKGTVQRVIPLNGMNLPGELKITTHQYFLAGGSSTQQKGVEPDVVIPGWKLAASLLEKASENSIPWAKIEGRVNLDSPDVKLWNTWKKNNLAALAEKSKQRVEANQELKDFFDLKKRRAKAEAEEAEEKPRKPDEAPSVAERKKKEDKDPQADEATAMAADMIPTWPALEKQAAK